MEVRSDCSPVGKTDPFIVLFHDDDSPILVSIKFVQKKLAGSMKCNLSLSSYPAAQWQVVDSAYYCCLS